MKLQFEKTNAKPRKGMFVALHNCFPIQSKGSLGVIIKIKKDGLGFNYHVHEFSDKKIYRHHISTIIPLKAKWGFKIK